jgi:hypothetical protein
MSVLYTFIILFLIIIALFLGQIAIQFIKLERKVETVVETLEEELIDVFGVQDEPQTPKKAEPEPAQAPNLKPSKPVKKPDARKKTR